MYSELVLSFMVIPHPAAAREHRRQLDAWQSHGLLIQFVTYTGLRVEGIEGLRIKDLGFGGRLRVHPSDHPRVNGERTASPKPKNSTREVPFARRALVADFREYLLTHPNIGDPDACCVQRGRMARIDWTTRDLY